MPTFFQGLSVGLRIKKNGTSDDDKRNDDGSDVDDDDEESDVEDDDDAGADEQDDDEDNDDDDDSVDYIDEEELRRSYANDYEKELTAEDFDGFVALLRNVCIENLFLDFTQEDEPLVRYWLASHSSDNFRLMQLCHNRIDIPAVYELFDDTLRILKPHQYTVELSALDRQRLLRQVAQLTHVVQRKSLLRAALCFKLDVEEGDIPAAIATSWFTSSWSACDISCHTASPSSWVDDLIESFLNGSFANTPDGSLSVVWNKPRRCRRPRLLKRPTQTDVPKPCRDFIDEHHPNREELKCDLFTFANENSRQLLQVYMWGIMDLDQRDDGTSDAHSCALLFAIVAQ